MLAKLAGALRGDKYMANAYPPAWRSAGDPGGLRQNHKNKAPAAVRSSVVAPGSGAAHGPAQIKER
jgi:hypothetical protein